MPTGKASSPGSRAKGRVWMCLWTERVFTSPKDAEHHSLSTPQDLLEPEAHFFKRYSRLIYLCGEYNYSVCSLMLRDSFAASQLVIWGLIPMESTHDLVKCNAQRYQSDRSNAFLHGMGLVLVTCNDHNTPSNHSILKSIPSWLKDLLQK